MKKPEEKPKQFINGISTNTSFHPTLNLCYFGENLSMLNVFDLLVLKNNKYRNFSIFNQSSKLLMLPYVLVFVLNPTVNMVPFLEIFNSIGNLVTNTFKGKKEDNSFRLLVNNKFLIMDFFPNSKLRYSYHLYVSTKENLILDDNALEELDTNQEIEIVWSTYSDTRPTNYYFKLSKYLT